MQPPLSFIKKEDLRRKEQKLYLSVTPGLGRRSLMALRHTPKGERQCCKEEQSCWTNGRKKKSVHKDRMFC